MLNARKKKKKIDRLIKIYIEGYTMGVFYVMRLLYLTSDTVKTLILVKQSLFLRKYNLYCGVMFIIFTKSKQVVIFKTNLSKSVLLSGHAQRNSTWNFGIYLNSAFRVTYEWINIYKPINRLTEQFSLTNIPVEFVHLLGKKQSVKHISIHFASIPRSEKLIIYIIIFWFARVFAYNRIYLEINRDQIQPSSLFLFHVPFVLIWRQHNILLLCTSYSVLKKTIFLFNIIL